MSQLCLRRVEAKTSKCKRCAALTSPAFYASRFGYIGCFAAVRFVRVFDSIRVFNCVLKQSRSERRPTGLMACAKTAAGFAVEVFVEQNQITPAGVGAVFFNLSVTRALVIFIRQKDAREPARKLLCNFLQREHFSRTYWTLYLQLIAVEMVVAFECLDDQVIDRELDRAAPVGVATEEVLVPSLGS